MQRDLNKAKHSFELSKPKFEPKSKPKCFKLFNYRFAIVKDLLIVFTTQESTNIYDNGVRLEIAVRTDIYKIQYFLNLLSHSLIPDENRIAHHETNKGKKDNLNALDLTKIIKNKECINQNFCFQCC